MALRRQLLAAPAVVALTGLASVANAQSAPAGPTSSSASQVQVEELVVTGSRVARSRLETSAPVDVVAAEALTAQAIPEVAQALANLAPSFTYQRSTVADVTDSVRPAKLRGLSPDQTLVLLNGVRQHSASYLNTIGGARGSAVVDLNTIPALSLQSIEVLRDGAAAQYGSDAIAGVINLRLREARSGGGASFSGGYYDTEMKSAREPDGRHIRDGATYSAAAWQGFALGEGFLTVTGEYVKRDLANRAGLDPRVTPPRVTSRVGEAPLENKTLVLNAGVPVGNGWSVKGLTLIQERHSTSSNLVRLENNINNIDIRTGQVIVPGGFLPLNDTYVRDFTIRGGVEGDVFGGVFDANITYGSNLIKVNVLDSLNGTLGRASPRDFYAGRNFYEQLTIGANFARPIEVGLPRPVNLAVGAEYRKEGFEIGAGEPASYIVGPDLGGGRSAGSQGYTGYRPTDAVDASRDSYAVYAELNADLTDALTVQVAGRHENYSDFGSTTNGKVSTRLEITPQLALRATASTGFRAPSLQQQYFQTTASVFQLINGVSTQTEVRTFQVSDPSAVALGAKPLEPEKSLNISGGLVFRRDAFELTLDAYRIKIEDRIVLSETLNGSAPGTPGATATQLAIYRLVNTAGSSITYAGGRFFMNGVESTTRGVDLVARYGFDTRMGRFDLTGAANYNETSIDRVPSTAVLSSLPVPPVLFGRANTLNFERGEPRYKIVLGADWKNDGPFSAGVRVNHYARVVAASNAPAGDRNAGEKSIVDAEGRWAVNSRTRFAVGASNLLDTYPNQIPPALDTAGRTPHVITAPWGRSGRYLYARIDVNW